MSGVAGCRRFVLCAVMFLAGAAYGQSVDLRVTNLFDKAPPRVDTGEVFGVNNIPLGNGYDLDGREFFGSIRYKF